MAACIHCGQGDEPEAFVHLACQREVEDARGWICGLWCGGWMQRKIIRLLAQRNALLMGLPAGPPDPDCDCCGIALGSMWRPVQFGPVKFYLCGACSDFAKYGADDVAYDARERQWDGVDGAPAYAISIWLHWIANLWELNQEQRPYGGLWWVGALPFEQIARAGVHPTLDRQLQEWRAQLRNAPVDQLEASFPVLLSAVEQHRRVLRDLVYDVGAILTYFESRDRYVREDFESIESSREFLAQCRFALERDHEAGKKVLGT